MFSSRSFIDLTLSLKSMIHFELIFKCGMSCFELFFNYMDIQLVQHQLLEKLYFPY